MGEHPRSVTALCNFMLCARNRRVAYLYRYIHILASSVSRSRTAAERQGATLMTPPRRRRKKRTQRRGRCVESTRTKVAGNIGKVVVAVSAGSTLRVSWQAHMADPSPAEARASPTFFARFVSFRRFPVSSILWSDVVRYR